METWSRPAEGSFSRLLQLSLAAWRIAGRVGLDVATQAGSRCCAVRERPGNLPKASGPFSVPSAAEPMNQRRVSLRAVACRHPRVCRRHLKVCRFQTGGDPVCFEDLESSQNRAKRWCRLKPGRRVELWHRKKASHHAESGSRVKGEHRAEVARRARGEHRAAALHRVEAEHRGRDEQRMGDDPRVTAALRLDRERR